MLALSFRFHFRLINQDFDSFCYILLQGEFIAGYKQGHRKQGATCIVNAGMRVCFEDNTNKVRLKY